MRARGADVMRIFNKKAISIIEYIVLLVIIIGAFLVLRGYIQRGIYGMWKKAGNTFSYGRQWDSQKSAECAFDEISNQWYDRNCFEQGVASSSPPCGSGNTACEEPVVQGCLGQGSMCDQINVDATPVNPDHGGGAGPIW